MAVMIRRCRRNALVHMAALLTCHNRRAKTLACLQSIYAQELPPNATVSVYLVDDGSTDGTSDAVASEFPHVHLLKGDGSLFWCGGMRVAWAEAMKTDYDAYLWVNDDSILFPEAIASLLDTERAVYRLEGRAGIIVGSCRDPKTGQHTYGGRVKRTRQIRLPDRPIPPGDEMRRCDTMNGNLVLVTREAFEVLGNLSCDYTHTYGDVDYGLRAGKHGIPVWIAPGYQAECPANTRKRPWIDPSVPLRRRWENMCSPLGLPPRQWLIYVRRHTGWQWPVYFAKPLLRVLFPGLWARRSST